MPDFPFLFVVLRLQGAAGFTVPMWIYSGDSSNTTNGNLNGHAPSGSSNGVSTPAASERPAGHSKPSSKSKNKVIGVSPGLSCRVTHGHQIRVWLVVSLSVFRTRLESFFRDEK